MIANYLKRSIRGRYLFFFLASFLLFYVMLNYMLFYWVDPQSSGANGVNDDVVHQIKIIKNRMNSLQESIDRSKADANELKKLLDQASAEMNSQNLVSLDDKTAARNEKLLSLLRDKTTAPTNTTSGKIAVLVISCRRPAAVENHLKQLIDNRRKSGLVDKFPIIVSQDCGDAETEKAIKKHSEHLYDFMKQPDLSEISVADGVPILSHLRGYYKISRHYKWALNQIFIKHGFESVIITEEDLNIAVDFFDYFNSLHPILVKDSDSLYCVSAWNDNGKRNLISLDKPELVHRSDFFPGLGWMMRRELWLEFKDKWPAGYWDDWMREEAQRKGRGCLRPEISRTEISGAFGKFGVSLGQFYDNYLKFIIINTKPVNWQSMDMSRLLKHNYDTKFLDDVYENSIEISFEDYKNKVQNVKDAPEPYSSRIVPLLITYTNKNSFVVMAQHFGIMDDPKCGVPRTAYKGVVRIEYNYRVIYIAPSSKKSWSGYDCNWQ